jgi:hypothetical protein
LHSGVMALCFSNFAFLYLHRSVTARCFQSLHCGVTARCFSNFAFLYLHCSVTARCFKPLLAPTCSAATVGDPQIPVAWQAVQVHNHGTSGTLIQTIIHTYIPVDRHAGRRCGPILLAGQNLPVYSLHGYAAGLSVVRAQASVWVSYFGRSTPRVCEELLSLYIRMRGYIHSYTLWWDLAVAPPMWCVGSPSHPGTLSF